MAPNPNIAIRVRTDQQDAERDLVRLAKKLGLLGGPTKRVSREAATFRGTLKALGATAAVVGAIQLGRKLVGGLARASVAMVNAAGSFELEGRRLSIALNNVGLNTDEVREGLLAYARDLQRVSVATEEQIIRSQAQSIAMGATAEKAKELALAATNLAAATGVDLDTAIRQLNATLGGLSGELGERVPEIKDLTEAQRRAGAAADVINKKFAGFGERLATTFPGAVNNTQTAVLKLNQVIGRDFAEVVKLALNEAVIPFIDQLTNAAEESDVFRIAAVKLGTVIVDLAIAAVRFSQSGIVKTLVSVAIATAAIQFSQLEKLTDILLSLSFNVENLSPGAQALIANLEGLRDSLTEFGKSGKRAGEDLGKGVADVVSGADQLDASLKALGITIEGDLQAKAENVGKAVEQMVAQLNAGEISLPRFEFLRKKLVEIAQAIVDQGGVVPAFGELKRTIETTEIGTLSLREAVAELAETGVTGLLERLKESTSLIESFGESVSRNVKGLAVNAALQFGDALVDAAFDGGVSFKDFFKTLLKDIAKAIVQATILKAVLGFTGLGFNAGGVVPDVQANRGGALTESGILRRRRGGPVPGVQVAGVQLRAERGGAVRPGPVPGVARLADTVTRAQRGGAVRPGGLLRRAGGGPVRRERLPGVAELSGAVRARRGGAIRPGGLLRMNAGGLVHGAEQLSRIAPVRMQDAGIVPGPRVGRDAVLGFLTPGERILTEGDNRAIERGDAVFGIDENGDPGLLPLPPSGAIEAAFGGPRTVVEEHYHFDVSAIDDNSVRRLFFNRGEDLVDAIRQQRRSGRIDGV